MISVLGISAFYHDSAAALVQDGKIIAAAQEERFTRKKHDSNYPFHAVEFVLKFANLKLSNVDHIVFYEKPFLKFERLLETYVAFAPRGFVQFSKAMPIWLRDKLFQKRMIFNSLKSPDAKVSPKVSDGNKQNNDPPPTLTRNRCNKCNKKLKLTAFKCRCDHFYCDAHRYSSCHDCPFDYKKRGRELLEKNNPLVVHKKIDKV